MTKRMTLREREQINRKAILKSYFGLGEVDYEEVPYRVEVALHDSWLAGYRAGKREGKAEAMEATGWGKP